ncbi:TPA: hypothetical protein DEO28_03515 [Candidatus Dependentiae bacterium]|nr:MAG: hypothetical protein UR14_C0007G0004 [candidate division TM6 bacterium GW2011_GWE2_31_21]KKP53635.1 MAG: hypothetical protein UR43_C0004G0176 [candidate division TM6 bacterium GW2011_GWF2_33_332]HBS48126.1 hypothetical protein [Candidatus Dependentiae bacterium]HBZ73550.1 hypothetical protein [Candidatus Dependentiae bacterium]
MKRTTKVFFLLLIFVFSINASNWYGPFFFDDGKSVTYYKGDGSDSYRFSDANSIPTQLNQINSHSSIEDQQNVLLLFMQNTRAENSLSPYYPNYYQYTNEELHKESKKEIRRRIQRELQAKEAEIKDLKIEKDQKFKDLVSKAENFRNNLAIKNFEEISVADLYLKEHSFDSKKLELLSADPNQSQTIKNFTNILNRAAKLRELAGISTQVKNTTDIVFEEAKCVSNCFENNDSKKAELHAEFCESLVDVGERYVDLLAKGIEVCDIPPELHVESCECFDYLSRIVYKPAFEIPDRFRNGIADNVKYKDLTLNFIDACKKTSNNLSEIILSECRDLEAFSKSIIDQKEDCVTRYEASYITNANNNILKVVQILFPNDPNLQNHIISIVNSEMEIARHASFDSNMHTVYAPTKTVFYEAAKVAKEKINLDLEKRKIETEGRDAYNQIKIKHENWFNTNRINHLEIRNNQKFDSDLDEEIKYLEDYSKSPKTNAALKKVANLAIQSANDAKIMNCEGIEQFEQADILKERVEIISKTFKSNSFQRQETKRYELSALAEKQLSLENIKSNLKSFSGNAIAQKLHKEIVYTLNESAKINDSFEDCFPVSNLTKAIYFSSDQAFSFNQNKNLERGFAFVDFSHSLLDLQQEIAKDIALGGEIAFRVAWAISKGVGLGIYNAGHGALNTFLHPIDTVVQTGEGLYKIGYLTCIASAKAYRAFNLAYDNPEEFWRKYDQYKQALKAFTKQTAQYVYENPEQALMQSTALITEFLVGSKLPTSENVILGKFSSIAKCLIEEQKVAKALNKTSLKPLLTPIREILKGSDALVDAKKQHGEKVVDSLLDLIKEEPAIVGKGKLKDFFKKSTIDDAKNVAQGDLKFLENDATHMFKNESGHLGMDTLGNRSLLESVVRDKVNFVDKDMYGTEWFAKITEDGKQIWVKVRDNNIRAGGINDVPKIWDPQTGFCRNLKPKKFKEI